jgi:hypothetical protein
MERFVDEIPAATIAIEKARARMILVAGGDDALWPSDLFARTLAQRLETAGNPHVSCSSIQKQDIACFCPAKQPPRSAVNAHGGTDETDRALGLTAWNEISRAPNFDCELDRT